ncbi:MAG: hypothetical protein AAF490_07170 [Chloroflexota bacterium]
MTTTILVRDETTLGQTTNELVLEFFTQTITVQALIQQRVKHEVTQFNRSRSTDYVGLVQPAESEVILNGFRMHKKREIDWQKQAKLAEEAFLTNGFILLVDDKQVTELDDSLQLHPNTQVTFLKLIPLVGG